MERAEFLYQGEVPFALAACERFETHPVFGHYDEGQQLWIGDEDIIRSLTATLTATPGDTDQDLD